MLLDQQRQDVDGAIEVSRAAVEADPRRATVQYNLGILLAERNDHDGAEKAYRAVIEANPKHAMAHTNLGAILADYRNDLDAAEASFHKAIALDPRLHEVGEHGSSICSTVVSPPLLSTNTSRSPSQPHSTLGVIYTRRATWHQQNGDIRRAYECFTRAAQYVADAVALGGDGSLGEQINEAQMRCRLFGMGMGLGDLGA